MTTAVLHAGWLSSDFALHEAMSLTMHFGIAER
jgi:hypothetical protein